MKKYFLVLGLLLASSCKTPCSDPKSSASLLSGAIIGAWDCKNGEAVKAAVSEKLASVNFCQNPAPQQMRGMISSLVCPLVVKELQSVVAKQVPAEWQCDPNKIGANAAMGLSALCSMLPF